MDYKIQILVALLLIIIIYIITIYTLNISSIMQNTNNIMDPKQKRLIVDGHAPISFLANKSWNTTNYRVQDFISLPKSVNTHGGAQFTYQFWIKIDNADVDAFKDLIVFIRGETQKYKLGLYDVNNSNKVSSIPENSLAGLYAIACPMIKFTDSYKNIQVLFNTNKNPLTTIDIKMNPNDDVLSRRNILSLLPLNWYMLTFCFQDNFSDYLSSENGINFKFWVNDILYHESTPIDTPLLKNNTLYENEGNLTLFPDYKGTDVLQLANFSFFNYSLGQDEITKIYNKGPPKKSALQNITLKRKPPSLSAFNKIDVYNY